MTIMSEKMKIICVALVGLLFSGKNAFSETEEVVNSNTRFAFDLYKQLASENEGNLFFSPYSVSSALAMTAEGARGETALEMGKVLRYPESAKAKDVEVPWDMTSIHKGMAALNDQFNGDKDPAKVAETKAKLAALQQQIAELDKQIAEVQEKRDWKSYSAINAKKRDIIASFNELSKQVDQYELNVANALWGERTYPFKEDYFDKISGLYKTGGVFEVDFKSAAEEVRQQINSWVEEKTKERIKDLIPEGALGSLTRLVLVNAIYFKGEWSVPFEEKDTQDLDFTMADGTIQKKPIMINNGLKEGSYAAFNADGSFYKTPARVELGSKKTFTPGPDGFAMAELPYKGNDLSMVIISPNDPAGLKAVEEKLNAENVSSWIAALQKRKMVVYLPKWKGETTYTLGDSDEPAALQKMGMERAFTDPRAANGAVFDGMSHAKTPAEKLYISKVLHKAFVEVNEKGTEAAAATAVILAEATSAPMDMPYIPVFKADRPFIYLIRDKVSGTILFVGRMMNPEV